MITRPRTEVPGSANSVTCSRRGQRFRIGGRVVEIETSVVDAVINGGHDDELLDCGVDTWIGRDLDGSVWVVADRMLVDRVL